MGDHHLEVRGAIHLPELKMDELEFGIVDQSPIRQGGTVQQALQETVILAQVAEKLGYRLVDHRLELYGSKIKK